MNPCDAAAGPSLTAQLGPTALSTPSGPQGLLQTHWVRFCGVEATRVADGSQSLPVTLITRPESFPS